MPVSGQITFDGIAIQSGTIVFQPAEHGLKQAVGNIESGQYKVNAIDGVTPGEYLVLIKGYRELKSQESESPLQPNVKQKVLAQIIPQKYNSKSELKIAIVANQSVYDFELSK